MKILAIESSCDDTSIAYKDFASTDEWVLSASQIDDHKKWGGVVPEIAARKHFEAIPGMIKEFESKYSLTDVDVIGVTYGPGLAGSLLVGLSFAKALAFSLGKKLTGVNHLYGHLCLNFPKVKFPAIALLISGGHTNLYYIENPYSIEEIGHTLDDAAGEAFDKVSKIMKLGYPGGPCIEQYAKTGKLITKFPIGLSKKKETNFSFSGLKTSVINFYKNNPDLSVNDIAYSFQDSVYRALLKKTKACFLSHKNVSSFIIGGGVSANGFIRNGFTQFCEEKGIEFHYPEKKFCTDNALMIAYGAYYKAKKNLFDDPAKLDIFPDERKLI